MVGNMSIASKVCLRALESDELWELSEELEVERFRRAKERRRAEDAVAQKSLIDRGFVRVGSEWKKWGEPGGSLVLTETLRGYTYVSASVAEARELASILGCVRVPWVIPMHGRKYHKLTCNSNRYLPVRKNWSWDRPEVEDLIAMCCRTKEVANPP